VYWFADGLRILRASPAQADLLGARIDAIDGRTLAQVHASIRRYVGGPDNYRRLRLTPMLESPGLLNAAGVANEKAALTISGVKADGTPFERRIEAQMRDRSAPVSSTPRVVFPVETPNAEGLRSFLDDGARLPLWLRDRKHLFTMSGLDNGGLYVALGFNNDADERRVSHFLTDVLARVVRDKTRFVVLDFRLNGGGNYTRTYPFMGALLEVLGEDGRVYALTSGWTFSAAITTVGELKTLGRKQVTLVGEPVGDRLDFWAEGNSFVLPNSFMTVHYCSARHDYHGRCTDPDCFWLNMFYPVHVDTLDPDVPAPLTFAAYRELRDPAMEAVMAQEAKAPTTPQPKPAMPH